MGDDEILQAEFDKMREDELLMVCPYCCGMYVSTVNANHGCPQQLAAWAEFERPAPEL